MTNKVGVTFIPGKWYKSNYNAYPDYKFVYVEDRFVNGKPNGVIISKRYKDGILEDTPEGYISNMDFLDNATECSLEDLIKSDIPVGYTNNSYSIF